METHMIEAIRTYHLNCKLDQAFGFSQWTYDQRNNLIVEIIDDSGAIGWGECYGPSAVTQSAITQFYGPLLMGKNPLQNEAIWQHLWRASLDFARKGIMMGAMSGIDMALLDLKGKLLNCSVSELIGGRLRDQVPCYATGMYFKDLKESELIEQIIDEAKGYVDKGYGNLKIKVGKNMTFDQQLVKAMREAFPEQRLMADSNHAYDLKEATRMGRLLEELDYYWFEEPLSPNHMSQFRQLSDRINIPIATGEAEQTRWGFQDLLSPGGVQFAQPDLAYCGGPSEALKIRSLASSMGVNVVPHAWGTMLNLACATHFIATSYVEPGRAEMESPMLEVDHTQNPMRDEMYAKAIQLENGMATVPHTPGLGVEPDRQAMTSFTLSQQEIKA
jgi:D-galactarolactone cycloisomerase